MIFKQGEYVFHKKNGMMFVEEIVSHDFGIGMQTYYCLKNVYGEKISTILLPVDNTSVIRKPSNKSSIEDFIINFHNLNDIWVADNKTRKKMFNDIFETGNPADLCNIIYTIYLKKCEFKANKKNLALSDSRAFEQALKLVCEEAAFVLDKDYDYVCNKLLQSFS